MSVWIVEIGANHLIGVLHCVLRMADFSQNPHGVASYFRYHSIWCGYS